MHLDAKLVAAVTRICGLLLHTYPAPFRRDHVISWLLLGYALWAAPQAEAQPSLPA